MACDMDWSDSTEEDSSRLILAEQPGEVDGFGVEVVAAGVEGFLAVAHHGVRGKGDDRNRRGHRFRLQALRTLPAVDVGHAEVHQDQIGTQPHRRVEGLPGPRWR